jgi:hypothetical protein
MVSRVADTKGSARQRTAATSSRPAVTQRRVGEAGTDKGLERLVGG